MVDSLGGKRKSGNCTENPCLWSKPGATSIQLGLELSMSKAQHNPFSKAPGPQGPGKLTALISLCLPGCPNRTRCHTSSPGWDRKLREVTAIPFAIWNYEFRYLRIFDTVPHSYRKETNSFACTSLYRRESCFWCLMMHIVHMTSRMTCSRSCHAHLGSSPIFREDICILRL